MRARKALTKNHTNVLHFSKCQVSVHNQCCASFEKGKIVMTFLVFTVP